MEATRRIYFDNAATTPVDPRVAEAMQPFLHDSFGNPSSLHGEGRQARQAVETGTAASGLIFGLRASEVIFTGSGTEADNMAIAGRL